MDGVAGISKSILKLIKKAALLHIKYRLTYSYKVQAQRSMTKDVYMSGGTDNIRTGSGTSSLS